MDYLAYDPTNARLWVPAGNTGRVDVIDVKSGKITPVEPFPTVKQVSRRGERLVGPSSATVGSGVVYIGNRADSKVCAVNAKTLKLGGCVALPSSPDGLAYVATKREVWVTTPRDSSITILDVKSGEAPAVAGTIKLPGQPEGYAVDPSRGLFYTNLEDQDQTLVIDAGKRQVVATWNSGCGAAGPRGLALDARHALLFVGCADKGVALSTGKDGGAVRGQIDAGGGVDFIDFDASRRLLYLASGKTATLIIASAGDRGELKKVASAATAPGARAVILDGDGNAYVADSAAGRLLVVRPTH
jgi:DNA-binding beta-propeller fold protein YncE